MTLSAHQVALLVAGLVLLTRTGAPPPRIQTTGWLRVYSSALDLVPRA